SDNMKKNKIILFDWGNIVESHTTNYNLYDAYNFLFKEFGCDLDREINLGKYHLSSISTMEEFEETFEKIRDEYHLKCDFQTFLEKYDYYFDKISYYYQVRDYEVSLKDRCFIGILSNLTIIDKKRLDAQVGLDNYDYVFLSFEFGCQKPDPRIYEMVSEKLPFDGKDILFIDDSDANIDEARKHGWNTLLATGLELDKIKMACEEFLR
ncbi:MAG: HAD family hydrolase, partial [Bacilli bacterium]|nr:HAD family hydrolase [Bacilli bacterium]